MNRDIKENHSSAGYYNIYIDIGLKLASIYDEKYSLLNDELYISRKNYFNTKKYFSKEERQNFLINHLKIDDKINLLDDDINRIIKICDELEKNKFGYSDNETIKALKYENIINIYFNLECLEKEDFLENAYLDLWRILEALFNKEGAIEFAKAFSYCIKNNKKKEFFEEIRINNNKYISNYIGGRVVDTKGKLKYSIFPLNQRNIRDFLKNKYKYTKFFFAIGYSLYQFRNQYIHKGYMFPSKILRDNSNTIDPFFGGVLDQNYGFSKERSNENNDQKFLYYKDVVNIYNQVAIEGKKMLITEELFILLPTYRFLKIIVRIILIQEFNNY